MNPLHRVCSAILQSIHEELLRNGFERIHVGANGTANAQSAAFGVYPQVCYGLRGSGLGLGLGIGNGNGNANGMRSRSRNSLLRIPPGGESTGVGSGSTTTATTAQQPTSNGTTSVGSSRANGGGGGSGIGIGIGSDPPWSVFAWLRAMLTGTSHSPQLTLFVSATDAEGASDASDSQRQSSNTVVPVGSGLKASQDFFKIVFDLPKTKVSGRTGQPDEGSTGVLTPGFVEKRT